MNNVIYSKGKNWNLTSESTPDFRSAIQYTNEMLNTVGPSGSEYWLIMDEAGSRLKDPVPLP